MQQIALKSTLQMTCTILLALIGSTMLKLSNGFMNFEPTVLCIICYGLSYYCFALALQTIPLAVGYALWSGFSTVGNAIIGHLIFQESLGVAKIIVLSVIVIGVILINNGKVVTERYR